MAWDLGRIIALCKWGYACEYLEEEEAWEKVMYYAKKIQPLYTSWEEYGMDYCAGRIFWAAGSGNEVSILSRTEQIYRYLISRTGYWRNFTWDINLDGNDQYEINTINWVEVENEFIQYKTKDSFSHNGQFLNASAKKGLKNSFFNPLLLTAALTRI
jgi:hypothetical protein